MQRRCSWVIDVAWEERKNGQKRKGNDVTSWIIGVDVRGKYKQSVGMDK